MLKNVLSNIDFQKRALGASSLKHDVISQNISNIETPGYKRKELIFDSLLNDAITDKGVALKRTHSAHIGFEYENKPYIKVDNSFSHRIDGNNVNVDTEMAEQAKNTIKYNAMITQLSSQIRRMKSAIRGGK